MKKLSFLVFLLTPFYAFGGVENCATRTNAPSKTLSLPDVIELGLCRNPQTAASYLAYESSRYSKNARQADIFLFGGLGRNRTGIQGFAVLCITTLPPSLNCVRAY